MRRPTRRPTKAAGSALALTLAIACGGSAGGETSESSGGATEHQGETPEIDAAIAELVDHAARKRASLDFAALPPWSARSGADPWLLLPDGPRTLGLSRRGFVVVLDEDAGTVSRVPTVVSAATLVRVGDELVIASEVTGELDVLTADTLVSRRRIAVPGVASIRAVAWGREEGRLYLADARRHRVVAIPWPVAEDPAVDTIETVDACNGPLGLARVGDWLVADCLLDHRVVARRVGDGGSLGPPATIEHDGPIWSFDAVIREGGTLALLLGGVEDHPLDRSDGAFGYIDSFVFAYDVEPAAAPSARLRHVLNASEHGVVTPKRVRWSSAAATEAMVTSYGSDVAMTIAWPSEGTEAAQVVVHHVPPGITDFTGTLEQGLFASPLLDAWIVTRPGERPRVIPLPDPTDDRTPSERLGEALVLTTLMAPKATSEGRRSRFTCETCHFEGTTDGRTHWTGRGDVHATTKTLRGLLNNRPHFSRALDRTTAGMAHAEFRVANRGTEQDPWFSLTRADAWWLDALDAPPDPLDPVTLRRALVDFLAALTPETNPAIHGLVSFTPHHAEGARLFAQHCESCHRARLVADDPASAVPFERWPALVLHPSGGIVWGSETRHRTGVVPYVHSEGARVPSLRRLYVKRPLLTNGSAATLEAVLEAVRLDVPEVHGGGSGRPLEADERHALTAFLELL